MINHTLLFASLLPLLAGSSVVAQEPPDSASAEALQKTQELLLNPQERQRAIGNDPKSQKVDQNLKKMGMNSEQEQKTYEISAEILQKMVSESGGNSAKMIKGAEAAQRNPSAFYESLTPEQKKKIQDLARELQPTAPILK